MPMVQHSLSAMLEFYLDGRISIEKLVEKMCHNPANLFQIEKRGYIKAGYFADLAIAALDDSIPLGRIDIGMNEPMNAEKLAKYASEYTGMPIKVSALPWALIGSVFSFAGLFKPEMADLKKMFDYMFTGRYVADTSLQQKYFGEVPTVKESVFRYCQQIGLTKKVS